MKISVTENNLIDSVRSNDSRKVIIYVPFVDVILKMVRFIE